MSSLSRFRLQEISINRLWLASIRRLKNVPDYFSWISNRNESKNNKTKLLSLRTAYLNERCYIMANGPSLGMMDLSPLNQAYTIGLNRIYLMFDRIPFKPSFYVCSNELVLEQFSDDIQKLTVPKFLNWNRRRLFSPPDEQTMFLYFKLSFRDGFGKDPWQGLWGGGTVTYVALQIAFYMGFKEVILIGLDHNFADRGTPNTIETRKQTADINHFHPDYFPKGTRWQLPDLHRSEIAYAQARQAFESDGRRIFDATIGGKCQVFEKVDYNSLF